jgi:enoyl-CoA hydratase
MAAPELVVEREDGYAVVTLNRPQAMNALSPKLIGDLCKAFRDLQGEGDIRAVILTGAGRAFCAGLDLKALGESEGGLGAFAIHGENDLYAVIDDFDRPVIVGVNGVGGDTIAARRAAVQQRGKDQKSA